MKRNRGFMRKVLSVSAAAILFGFGVTGNAWADAYSVSINTISNFSFSGGGNLLESNPNSSATDSANYSGFPSSSNSATCPGVGPCNPGGLSANPLQATAGPGPFPPQDTYTQPPAGGFVGSRGDANVTSVSFNLFGGGAQNVAETRATAGGVGGSQGTNHISTTIQVGIPAGTTQAIAFSFTGDPYMQVTVGQVGEIAFSDLSTRIILFLGPTQVLLWTPGVSAGQVGVASETDPFSLNQQFNISSPAGNQTFNPVASTFNATSVGLGPGTYTLNIDLSETVRATAAQAVNIPEPSALFLFVAGLAGIARTVARRERHKK